MPYKLFCNSPHMCARHLPGSPLVAVRQILFFLLERGSTPFAHRQVPHNFLQVLPWRSPTALLSAPPAAASTRTTLASRASCIPSRPTSRARWASLVAPHQSVSAHPVLMGALSVSRGHTSLGTLVFILWRRMYSTSSRLAWAHRSGSSLCCHPSAILPTH